MGKVQTKSKFSGKHLLIAVGCIVMGYMVITGIRELKASRAEKENWSAGDHGLLVNRCIEDTGERGRQFPEITKEYCDCSTKMIIAKIKKKRYLSIISKPMDKQADELLPVFKSCLDDYQAKISEFE